MGKINVAELLKGCPSGMELDCTMYENVYFNQIYENENCLYSIGCYTIVDGIRTSINFTKLGEFNTHRNSKCVIFPKGKTTWEGFVPPCQFKNGDIVYVKSNQQNEYIIIFKEIRNEHIHKHVCFAYQHLSIDKCALCHLVDAEVIRLATEEEKAKLFDAIKANGYKWNPETKTLEKLIEPKFKVGDTIRRKNSNEEYIITSINDYTYYYRLNEHCTGSLGIQLQDEYELVPDKFVINTLVPFESKVLIRDTKSQKWSPAIWGFYDSDHQDYQYKLVGVIARYCIPYEGNEHLLGKTDDCDEYFKTWK